MEDINNQKEEPMKVIYDLFDVPKPLIAPKEKRSSKHLKKRKRTFFGTMEINPKRKNTTSSGSSQFQKEEDIVEWPKPLTGWTGRRTF